MEWTKVSTDLITKRFTDYELASIVKFQLVWAINEEQPDKKTCLRYMTEKQYDTAMTYLDSISARVCDDVSSVLRKREVEKIRYNKNKNLPKILPADSKQNVGSLPPQRREEKNIYIYNNINNNPVDNVDNFSGKKVLIEDGKFYIDDTMPEYKDLLKGVSDDTINRVWTWIHDNFYGRELAVSWVRDRIKQFTGDWGNK